MAYRIDVDHVTAVLLDRWYTVAHNSFAFDHLVWHYGKAIEREAGLGFVFTDDTDTTYSGPIASIRALTHDDR